MQPNPARFSDGSRGSIVLVTSTSGYFGGTGVAAYISSKHGVTGLLRSCQVIANKANIRVNAVAPSFTPTRLTKGFANEWYKSGIESNTAEGVAAMIAQISADPSKRGTCCLVGLTIDTGDK